MLDLMYEIPSRLEVVGCTITREVIEKKTPPILAFRGDRQQGSVDVRAGAPARRGGSGATPAASKVMAPDSNDHSGRRPGGSRPESPGRRTEGLS